MEVRAVGSVAAERGEALLQLLAALSGQTPAPITFHEIVMRCEGEGRRDLHLVRTATPADAAHPAAAESWSACQYGQPPWGDKALGRMPASVRTLTAAPCAGPDVPGFWSALGFAPQYELRKDGRTADVRCGGHTLHVVVSRLLRGGRGGEGGGEGGEGGDAQMQEAGQGGDDDAAEVVPRQLLVEAWTPVAPGAHAEAVAAVAELAALLRPRGVELQPMPRARGKYSRVAAMP